MELSKTGTIFSEVLKRQYPDIQEKDEITLDDLLEWQLWPCFIDILGKDIMTRNK